MNPSEEKIQTLALSLVKNMGPVTFKKWMEVFGSVSGIFHAPVPDLKKAAVAKIFWPDLWDRSKLLKKAEEEMQKARKKGVRIVTCLDKEFPADLREIYDPPIVLYVKGSLPDAGRPKIAVVGSRQASLYGLRTAKTLSRDLAASGVVIVSGMARGIDTAAHEGALLAGGCTLAVLGAGISNIYPPENEKMAARIIEEGALISEYPMDTSPRPEYFPVRNRIISGLSRAVLVVEAHDKSGALITADAALEQGRDVFAVPGNVDSVRSGGTNGLLKEGAKLVLSAEDILEELQIKIQKNEKKSAAEIKPLDKNEKKLFSIFENEALQAEDLIERSGLSAREAMSALTFLEIKGLIQELPGKNFVKRDHAANK